MTPGTIQQGDGSDPRRWPVRHVTSYGGVAVDGAQVALIRPRRDPSDAKDPVWALPKGEADDGEAPEAAAIREVREETGLDAEIVEPLEPITYWFAWAPERLRYRKTVRFYLMRVVGGDTASHDDEVADVRLVPIADASSIASYRSEREVLQQAAERVATW